MEIIALGYFYKNGIQGAGQQIRTSSVCDSVEFYCPDDHLIRIDLSDGRLKSIIRFILKLRRADVLLIFPGENLLPFIEKIVNKYRKKTILIAIGGWLPSYISADNIDFFRSLKKIFVQTGEMVYLLRDRGINNVVLFPNYRILRGKNINIHYSSAGDTFKMIFCSRIDERKGIFEIVKALRMLINEGKDNFEVDFYGNGPKTDIDKLKSELSNISQAHYLGYINNSEIIETISKYDVMLFPTYYEGEGFPGVIVESLIAGVPVIATRWKYNEEYIIDQDTGLLCNIKDENDLHRCIAKLFENRELVNSMKQQCLKSAEQYTEEQVVKPLINTIKNM